jgi:hypothetical protein
MAQADGQVVALPNLAELGQLDDQMGQRADGNADRQALDPHDRRQEDGGQDDDQVVGQRRQRGHGEALVRVQDAADHGAHAD